MKRFLKALFITGGRIEYFTADLTPFVTGILLGFADYRMGNRGIRDGIPLAAVFVLGLLTVICSHYFTVWANVYADYEMDKRFKSELSDSVDTVGKGKLLSAIWLFVLAGLILIVALSLLLERWILTVLWAVGTFWALTYSFEPIRFKRTVILGDIARGLPIVITVPFGYFLFGNGFGNGLGIGMGSLLFWCTAGLGINLFGLFMIGEVWDWKDDQGIVNTVAVTWGYRAALNIGMVFIPAGALCWLFSYRAAHGGTAMRVYFWAGMAVLALFMTDLVLRVYRKRGNYDAIEAHCGIVTKAGTTLLWVMELAGAAVLAAAV